MTGRALAATEALRHGGALLQAAGVDTPRLDARLLLAHAAGLSQAELLLDPGRAIDASAYQALLGRRAAREPLALILGWQEFWSLRFAVSPATLIPRADSETLIEAAVAAMPDRSRVRRVLDLGTGTGCLLLAALTEFTDAWGVGTDRNPAAVGLAAENARSLGLARRSAMLCADWAAPLQGRFDLVLSNPPYVARHDLAGLMPEVSRYEPATALDGGPDGLDAYRALVRVLPGLLQPGGMAVLELGAGQEQAVAALARSAGLRPANARRDLAGVARALPIWVQ